MSTDDTYAETSREMSDWATATRNGWTVGSAGDPFTPGGTAAAGGRRPRRGLRVGLVAAGVALAVGGVSVGAYAAYEKLIGGGGPQPESALPSTAVAFVKVDLDPSGSQKVSAIRFARKFPKAPAEATKDDADLRQVVFDQIKKSGALSGLDYATDVKPWLGNRFAVALLPAEGDNPQDAVVALAVTDRAKATSGLAKAGPDVHCSVGPAFALCSDTQATVDRAVTQTAKATLADATSFSGDMHKLGADGIVSFWGDLASASRLGTGLPGLGGASLGRASLRGTATGPSGTAKGRVAGALRFEGANLELVGRVTALANPVRPEAGTGIEQLPAGTIVGVGLAGGGAAVKRSFATLTAPGSPLAGGLGELADSTGVTLPDDLVTLLGARTSVAFGGLDGNGDPLLALLTSSPKADVQGVVGKLSDAGVTPSGRPLSVIEAGGQTVVSLSSSYAATVAGSHGLGSSAAFTSALPDVGTAQFAAFVDLDGLVATFGKDMSDSDRAGLKALRAVGLTVGRDGDDATFRLRLTTK